MGSAGLEFDAGDQPEATRLNQKCNFSGTGAQIAAIGTTYKGMLAFCESTGSGFTVNHVYQRNAANTAWIDYALDGIQITAELNTTPISDTADFTVTAGQRYYAFITLPTDHPVYIITGIEWKNGATVAGNVMCGVDIIDADPPTIASTPLSAVGAETAQSGTSAVQRNSNISNNMFPAGAVLGVWISLSNATATVRHLTGAASQNQQKGTAYSNTPPTVENTGWGTSTTRKYIKVYYVGYH